MVGVVACPCRYCGLDRRWAGRWRRSGCRSYDRNQSPMSCVDRVVPGYDDDDHDNKFGERDWSTAEGRCRIGFWQLHQPAAAGCSDRKGAGSTRAGHRTVRSISVLNAFLDLGSDLVASLTAKLNGPCMTDIGLYADVNRSARTFFKWSRSRYRNRPRKPAPLSIPMTWCRFWLT